MISNGSPWSVDATKKRPFRGLTLKGLYKSKNSYKVLLGFFLLVTRQINDCHIRHIQGRVLTKGAQIIYLRGMARKLTLNLPVSDH